MHDNLGRHHLQHLGVAAVTKKQCLSVKKSLAVVKLSPQIITEFELLSFLQEAGKLLRFWC